MRWKPLYDFMRERHEIYVRRFIEDKPWPWTTDKILQRYRFCNVYRELDTVTQWIDAHIRRPYADHPNLWFMLCVARQINWPDTLKELMDEGAWPRGTWNPARARKVMLARQARGEKLYTGAYILNGQLGSKRKPGTDDKAYYTCHVVLQSAWENKDKILQAIVEETTLQATWEALLSGFGWGPFTAYEVVCDLRYTRYLKRAGDKLLWANPGPGAKRGLDWLDGRKKKDRPDNETMIQEMRWLHSRIAPEWERRFRKFPELELREIEHSLCEYDKYHRTEVGKSRPKATYTPPEIEAIERGG